MDVNLENMALIVTGAASGIGRAIAVAAARSGASSLLLSDVDAVGLRDTVALMGATSQVETCVADLADPSAPAQIVQAALAAFGRLDGLANAAGLTDRASFLDGTAALWDRLFDVNARAPFLLMHEVISHLLARKAAGSILNIQSVNAHCGHPELAIYSATKGALQTLTKNAANAHKADKIRVNGINLGWVLTDAENAMQTEKLGAEEDWAAKAGATMPLGRLLVPDEVARTAVFLLSPASAPMTGACVELDQVILGAPH